MDMKKTSYSSPVCEEISINLEGAVMSCSIPDFLDGGDLFDLENNLIN